MRKLALITGMVSALTLVKPFSSLVLTMGQVRTSVWANISAVSMAIFALLVAAVELVFYFALYHDQGTLRVSRRLQVLGRTAALVLGLILAADLPTRISALLSDWADTIKLDWWNGTRGMWSAARDPFTAATINNALDLLLSVLSIALLVALSRNPNDQGADETPVSRLLRVVSEMTGLVLGLLLVMELIGLALDPFNYSVARDYFYRYSLRGTPPRLLDDFLLPRLRTIVLQACLFVTPFLVWKASQRYGGGPASPREV